MKKRGNASTQRRQLIYKKRLWRLNFSLLSTNTKWMVFGITSSCSKRRSQCCSPLLCCNTTWSKEAIAAAAEMRSPDGPSRRPSTTTFVCYPPHCHFFLKLTSMSYVQFVRGVEQLHLRTQQRDGFHHQHPLLLVVVILFLSCAAGSFYLLLSASCIIDERVWELYFFSCH